MCMAGCGANCGCGWCRDASSRPAGPTSAPYGRFLPSNPPRKIMQNDGADPPVGALPLNSCFGGIGVVWCGVVCGGGVCVCVCVCGVMCCVTWCVNPPRCTPNSSQKKMHNDGGASLGAQNARIFMFSDQFCALRELCAPTTKELNTY